MEEINLMQKVLFLILLGLFCAPLTFAQGGEVFAGYSYNRLENTNLFTYYGLRRDENLNANGFNVAATAYLTKRLGITGDVSGHYKTREFAGTLCPPGFACTQVINNYRARTQLYDFLAGPQYKLRDSNRVQPFAHALFGFAHTRTKLENLGFAGNPPRSTPIENIISSNDFAMALGGGVDVKLNDRFGLRAIQADYNPVFYRNRTINGVNVNGVRSDNLRLSVGVVIKR